MEFIKQNSNIYPFENKIKIVSSLPASGIENEIILVESNGIYQYHNSNWDSILSFSNSSSIGKIIGEIKPSLVPQSSEWLLCDGSTFDTSLYPELYTLLGNNSLPDLREVLLVGVGENTTDTISNHDIFTLGQLKESKIVQHCHIVCNDCHTHNFAVCNHSHSGVCQSTQYCNNPGIPNMSNDLTFPMYGRFTQYTAASPYCITQKCPENIGAFIVAEPKIGETPHYSTKLRTNSFGVNFYIRAK